MNSSAVFSIVLVLVFINLLNAAPVKDQITNDVAPESELADLIKQRVPEAAETKDPENKDQNGATKVLVQRTKIVIPVDDDKPSDKTEDAEPSVPEVHEQQQVPVVPARIPDVKPEIAAEAPETVDQHGFNEAESQFLYPADYQLGEENYERYGNEEVDLTPRAVAEYLILTGDFQGFDEAITDLLTTQMLTLSQVEQYRAMVGEEYERLMSDMVAAETDYLQQQQQQQLNNEALFAPVDMSSPSDLFAQNDLSDLLSNLNVDQLSQDPEARRLLQALLQDYEVPEEKEYNDYIDYTNNNMVEQPIGQDVAENENKAAEDLVEEELESLPENESTEEESSGEEEILNAANLLSKTQKKLKKATEAKQ